MVEGNAPPDLRIKDMFHHIDMGFLNQRLSLTAIGEVGRQLFSERRSHGSDHMAVLGNNHLLVTMLIDMCDSIEVLTLHEALTLNKPKHLFRSTERLAPCPEIYTEDRVEHEVLMGIKFEKPITIAYHTTHIVSDTGRMTLAHGADRGYRESIIGLLHNLDDRFEIEPIVIGAPWYDHPRNGSDGSRLMWVGRNYGEILPEDIEQFSKMTDITVSAADEWMNVMQSLPEAKVKEAFADLLAEPTKKDWGGESNDHFSSNVVIGGHRKTAAFLLKGPSKFREMTLDMCGTRADQIYRLVRSNAEISIVQHAHLIGEAVRETLRSMVVRPGSSNRKFCVIDGQATYRILKAYSFI